VLTAALSLDAPLIAEDIKEVDSAIREEVVTLYDFSPHKLRREQQNEKSELLDAFWKKVNTNRTTYLPALRVLLRESNVPAFFLYDGSMLLLSLSDTPDHRKIALQAIARCDIRDIQPLQYLRQVHRMAVLGEDATDAALHVLDRPEFKVFIVQHALTLAQNYSLVSMLLPVSEEHWVEKAIARLELETDETSQKSLLLLLWYAQTGDADAALSAFIGNEEKPQASRDYGRELLEKYSTAADSVKSDDTETEDSIRKARRSILGTISDETLDEVHQMTYRLAKKRH
jgi:hypothetical protein